MSKFKSEDTGIMAEKFKALSNPVRLRVFNELMHCCAPGATCRVERCIGELAELVDVASSTLSHHMKELNRSGLVTMERSGKNILCRVNPSVLKDLSDYFKV